MTRAENLHWLNEEIRTWENECQSKHPIKEALYAARKALEKEPSGDAISRQEQIKNCDACVFKKEWKKIGELVSVILKKQIEQESCKECENSPKTYEEYCIGQSNPSMYCPDAYTEKSHLCGNYGKEDTPQESEEQA